MEERVDLAHPNLHNVTKGPGSPPQCGHVCQFGLAGCGGRLPKALEGGLGYLGQLGLVIRLLGDVEPLASVFVVTSSRGRTLGLIWVRE